MLDFRRFSLYLSAARRSARPATVRTP
jgi:hypothetical protein